MLYTIAKNLLTICLKNKGVSEGVWRVCGEIGCFLLCRLEEAFVTERAKWYLSFRASSIQCYEKSVTNYCYRVLQCIFDLVNYQRILQEMRFCWTEYRFFLPKLKAAEVVKAWRNKMCSTTDSSNLKFF